jgi:CBS domain-containing protein
LISIKRIVVDRKKLCFPFRIKGSSPVQPGICVASGAEEDKLMEINVWQTGCAYKMPGFIQEDHMITADVMTKSPITVQPEMNLRDAARIMLAHHVSGLPVRSEAGEVVGIITDGDLLRRPELGTEGKAGSWLQLYLAPESLADNYVHTHGRYVSEVMTRDVVSIAPDTPLSKVAELMHQKHLKCLPVLEAKRLVGVISRRDLLNALALKLSEPVPVNPTAESIRASIEDTLAHERWAPKSGIQVKVAGKVVTLEGAVVDEAARKAVLVIVENTPGVKEVRDNLTYEDRGESVGF